MEEYVCDYFSTVFTEDAERVLSCDLPWKSLAGTSVLVTGASGMIPAMIVEVLVTLSQRLPGGLKVLGLVRNHAKGMERLGHLLPSGNFHLLVQDVCDPLPDEIKADYVIHAASTADPVSYCRAPVQTILPNIIGTNNLLEVCRRGSFKKFLFLSSGEIYGDLSKASGSIRENYMGAIDPLALRSCYAESKRAGENLCSASAMQYGIPAVIARIFHTYGPGMHLDDGRIFASIVADVLRRKSITLRGDGTASRSFCYLSDLVAGLFTILLKGKDGQAYNVGNEDEEYSIRDLATLVASQHEGVGVKCQTSYDGEVPPAVNRAVPDTEALRSLGWHPTVTAEKGFRRTISTYKRKAVV